MEPLNQPTVPSSSFPGMTNIPNAGFFPQKLNNPQPIRASLPKIPTYSGNNPVIRAQIGGYGITNNGGMVDKSHLPASAMIAPRGLSGIQGFKNGGVVPKDGIYKLHKGEKIIPNPKPASSEEMSTGGVYETSIDKNSRNIVVNYKHKS